MHLEFSSNDSYSEFVVGVGMSDIGCERKLEVLMSCAPILKIYTSFNALAFLSLFIA